MLSPPIKLDPAARAQTVLTDAWRVREKIVTKECSIETFLEKAPTFIVENFMKMKILSILPRSFGQGKLVAGVLDRKEQTVSIASGLPETCARFTLAHEIGHFYLHEDTVLHRDIIIWGHERLFTGRPKIELEADAFAANLLMPTKYLKNCFCRLWRGPIEGVTDELAHTLSNAFGRTIKRSSLAMMSLNERASLIAKATVTTQFSSTTSLAARFGVSSTAMSIRLQELELVG